MHLTKDSSLTHEEYVLMLQTKREITDGDVEAMERIRDLLLTVEALEREVMDLQDKPAEFG